MSALRRVHPRYALAPNHMMVMSSERGELKRYVPSWQANRKARYSRAALASVSLSPSSRT
jgi:hypothetical protein